MLLFVHGWGLTASLWDPVRARLDCPNQAVDLGYGGDAQTPAAQGRVIGVGHSLGALWLLHTMPERLAGFVAIGGFARFAACPDWPNGVAPRLLSRMRAAWPHRPAAVLDEFRARIGLPGWAGPRDDAALAAHLEALASWDARDTLRRLAVPVRFLAAADDPVVSPGLATDTAALAGAACRWVDSGGHLLPLTQPAWCAREIAALAA
jgi:pimeloyl-[acyl-carrier protein] methyl ester esterase